MNPPKSRLQQLLAVLLGQRPILRREEHRGAQVALLHCWGGTLTVMS